MVLDGLSRLQAFPEKGMVVHYHYGFLFHSFTPYEDAIRTKCYFIYLFKIVIVNFITCHHACVKRFLVNKPWRYTHTGSKQFNAKGTILTNLIGAATHLVVARHEWLFCSKLWRPYRQKLPPMRKLRPYA